jgi:hypothetical protein
MVDHYDRVLAGILLLLVAGGVASLHPAVAAYQGLAAGSLAAMLLLYDVIVRNPPVEPTHSTTAAPVAVGIGWLLAFLLFL